MKQRIYLIILLSAMAVISSAQTVGEAMYIYRNNGQIMGFLPNEIESMEFSHFDIEGKEYEDVVTQVINTADSIYMISLSEIDSISFVTPKTEYQPGVINLSDALMPYIVSSDSLTITVAEFIPSSLMPKVGDKLVTLEMNEKFPVGFAGEVVSASATQIKCKAVSLEEIFKTYSKVSSTYGYQDVSEAKRSLKAVEGFSNRQFKLGKYSMSRTSELSYRVSENSNLALIGGTELSIGITPTFHVISTLIINQKEGVYFSACITSDMTFEESVSIYGGIEWSKDFLDKEWVRAPVGPMTFFYMKPGLFFKSSATASLSAQFSQRYTCGLAFDFSSKNQNVIRPTCGGRLVSANIDVEGSIEGKLSVGGFVEIGLDILSSDIDNLAFRGELGVEGGGHAVLYNSDILSASKETKVYERFKNSSFVVNAFVSTAVQAECGRWGFSQSLPWNMLHNIRTWDVVPTFSNTTFEQKPSPKSSADGSINISGDCLMPVEVGLSVRNQDGEEVLGNYAATKFLNGNKQYKTTFSNLNAEENYTLYPKVKIFGYEMLASPSSDLEKKDFPVAITDFKQTDSNYKKDGYSHDGQTYSYRFDCAVTVELSNSDNVEDWGYIYQDLSGKTAKISLKSYSSPYTDNRYVYYRNESNSTVTLYEYVKYRGDDEYYYGEQKDYDVSHKGETSCPDANHPHWIDMGLPSGTQWRCCNEGASTPEAYGGYYTFGQVASAPFLDQIKELLNYCTSVWATQNGVNGRKFTGPNGGTIFLPAAGVLWHGELHRVGSNGRYWSSTPLVVGAYSLEFTSGYADYFGGSNRGVGQSVRPVR